jgi:prepilin-type N-terminal cleavage/methylation domain-containing protein
MKSFYCGREKGFTLVEVLIIVGILGVLAAIIFPNLGNIVGVADLNAANMEADAFRKVVQAYASQTGNWPPAGDYGPTPPDGAGLGVLADYVNKKLRGTYTVYANGTVEGKGGWNNLIWQNGRWVKAP